MTDDTLGSRVRDAVATIAMPPYPRLAMHARLAAGIEAPAMPRRRRPALAFAALATLLVAVSVAASAANGGSKRLSDAVVHLFNGIPLSVWRGPVVHPRIVSLAAARADAGFTIIVPPHERVVRTELVTLPAGTAYVQLTLQDGRHPRVLTELPPGTHGEALILDKSFARREPRANANFVDSLLTWRVGDTRLVMRSFDARQRAFAERVHRETLAATR